MRARVTSALAFTAFSLVPLSAHAQSAERVRVHLSGADDAILQMQSEHDTWRSVCFSPCDVKVRSDVRYRIAGDDILESAPFWLDAVEGSETLEVKRASASGQATGWILFIVGALGGVVGGYVTYAGFAWKGCEGPAANGGDIECHAELPELVPVGIVALVGSVFLAGAGVMIAANTRVSTVTQVASAPQVPRVRWFAGGVSPLRAHEASRDRAPSLSSPAIMAPIVTVSF